MAMPKTARGRAWISLVRKYGGVIPAARAWRKMKSKPGYADNPGNPKGYIKVRGKKRKITRYVRRRKSGQIKSFHPPKSWKRAHSKRKGSHRRKGGILRRIKRIFANPPARRSGHRRLSVFNNPAVGIMQSIQRSINVDTLVTVSTQVASFGGVLAASKFVTSKVAFLNNAIGRVAATLLSAVGLSYLANMLVPRLAGEVMRMGLFATGYRGLTELVPAEKRAAFPMPLLSGMGDASEEAFKRAIEGEIINRMRRSGAAGVGAYLTAGEADRAGMGQGSYFIQPAGVHEYVEPAGQGAYLTAGEAERAGMGEVLEFSRGNMAERF